MKIMHCSDIHLGRRPVGGIGEYSNKRYQDYFTAFESLAEKAISHDIKVLLITGDLFDRKELIPEVLSKTELILKKVTEHGIKILLTEGNHDNITPGKEADSWLIYLEKKGYLSRPFYRVTEDKYDFSKLTINNINFYGLGYPGCLVNETLSKLAEHLDTTNDKNNIVLVHTAISNTDFLPGTVEQDTINLFKNKVLYIAAGHFHTYHYYPKEKPYFFVPGCPEYWDLAEQGERGAILFDTETLEHKLISSKRRNKKHHTLKVCSEIFDDFKEEFSKFCEKLNIAKDEDILIISLELKKSFYIDTNWCEEHLTQQGALKSQLSIKHPGHKRTNSPDAPELTIAEIENEVINNWELFSSKSKEIGNSLTKLKDFQQENNQDMFFEVYEKMLEMFLTEGESNENK